MNQMKEKKIPKVLLTQIEQALEEREGRDRRVAKQALPDHIEDDRRKNDRRSSGAK